MIRMIIKRCITKRDVFLLILLSVLCCELCDSGTYEDQRDILDRVFNSSYRTQIRPVNNQSNIVHVGTSFHLVSIVGIDDVSEMFQCNGFLSLFWNDERLRWDPIVYGSEDIRPDSKDVWKPRVLLLNTLAERDLFEDDNAPLSVESNGDISWSPGSVFTVSCELDMSNYPYDTQICNLLFIANGFPTTEVLIHGTNEPVRKDFFTPSGEWNLVASNVTEQIYSIGPKQVGGIKVSFTMQRRPTFLMLNVVLPVVFLSFLNILVFLIPVDSGEKISYGITVLLAVSVFLSIISSMLPRSSKIVPNVTVYLACLLIMSVLTVVDCIIIVFLHNLEENESASIKASENFGKVIDKIKTMNNAVAPASTAPRLANLAQQMTSTPGFMSLRKRPPSSDTLPPYDDGQGDGDGDGDGMKLKNDTWDGKARSSDQKKPRKNKYRHVGKYIDLVSFVVFLFIWVALTVGFLVSISSATANN